MEELIVHPASIEPQRGAEPAESAPELLIVQQLDGTGEAAGLQITQVFEAGLHVHADALMNHLGYLLRVRVLLRRLLLYT